MGLHRTDITIIIGYLIFVTLIGLLVSKKAKGNVESYFLGGRALPWFLLGISGMATFVDMGGTAYQCAWFYLLGAKGFWYTVEGAVALLLSFQMIYIGKWLNRSGVMTNAGWMIFRFGKGTQGESARIFSAISALVICGGMMTVFFKGASKVLPEFIPFINEGFIENYLPIFKPENSENVAALLFFVLVGIYTISSGFYGVIYTDFVQAFLILFLILFVAIKAFATGTPEYFNTHAPAGWLELFPRSGNWSISLPEIYQQFSSYFEKAKYLGVFVVFWIANNLLQGLATPFDSWTAQRYYAAKNERESSLLVFQWITLWSFRFLLMAGVGVLAISLVDKISHPEVAMSVVIAHYIPIGVKGLLLAALLAAGMSTIDSTVNSAGAYFVSDVYQRFIAPKASQKHLVYISYAITFFMFVIGISAGWFVEDISTIWGWIIMGLFVGTLPPNILKWYWWRANGYTFSIGTLGGLVAALLIQLSSFKAGLVTFATDVLGLQPMESIISFVFVLLVAVIFCIIGTYIGKPTDTESLLKFYKKTKPFGFWGHIKKQCDVETASEITKENKRDLLLMIPAFSWHVSLFLMMSSLIFKNWLLVSICLGVNIIALYFLYKYWYKNLKTEKALD